MATRNLRTRKPKIKLQTQPEPELFSENFFLQKSKIKNPSLADQDQDQESNKENLLPPTASYLKKSSIAKTANNQSKQNKANLKSKANKSKSKSKPILQAFELCSTPSALKPEKNQHQNQKPSAISKVRLPFKQLSISDLDEQGRNQRSPGLSKATTSTHQEFNEPDTFDFEKEKHSRDFFPCSPVALNDCDQTATSSKITKYKLKKENNKRKLKLSSISDSTKRSQRKNKKIKFDQSNDSALSYIDQLFEMVERDADAKLFKKLAGKRKAKLPGNKKHSTSSLGFSAQKLLANKSTPKVVSLRGDTSNSFITADQSSSTASKSKSVHFDLQELPQTPSSSENSNDQNSNLQNTSSCATNPTDSLGPSGDNFNCSMPTGKLANCSVLKSNKKRRSSIPKAEDIDWEGIENFQLLTEEAKDSK